MDLKRRSFLLIFQFIFLFNRHNVNNGIKLRVSFMFPKVITNTQLLHNFPVQNLQLSRYSFFSEQVRNLIQLLPPAYVVRREGNVLTRVCPSICLSTGGGYPYPIMLCNISQNAMGQPGGVPCQVQPGGGVPWWGGGEYPARGGIPWRGYPGRGGTLAGGVPCPGGVPS